MLRMDGGEGALAMFWLKNISAELLYIPFAFLD